MVTETLLDGRVYAVHAAQRLPLLQGVFGLSIAPEDSPIAAFCHEAFFERIDLDETMHDATLYLRYGCMTLEILYAPPDPVDGRVYLRGFSPRMPWTLDPSEPFVRRDNRLVAFRQLISDPERRRRLGTRTVDIPAHKCLHFVHERIGSDLYGQPMSRWFSKAAQIKDAIERADAIAASRTGSGIPVWTLGRGDVRNKDAREYAKRVVRGIKVDEEEGVVETDREQFRLEGIRGTVHPNDKSMRYHQEGIADAAGLGSQDLGRTQSGSRALAEPLLDKEQLSLLHKARYLCKEFNKAMERLVRLNFPGVTRVDIPRMTCSLRETRNQMQYISALSTARRERMLGPWGLDDVNQLRRELNHRALSPEEMAAYVPEPEVNDAVEAEDRSDDARDG
jgi:hypothetical protein